ncbi:tetratricopeptide repeat protein [Methanothrix soehngenii]|jgi:tetratricopeptide (TPR) repeat protein|uniref:Lipoprotein NlpI n=1 Tax=Candidatus Methanofastidiosum methylothiophilum TaxID=1705564 RepID=A0A150J3S3_9EURY|nr:MAG: lipoprotein NlpI [Candidatus Methanofastidiosum methylthiophilus]
MSSDILDIRSLKKICKAYKQIFSIISPFYHKRDFEINKRGLFISLVKEMNLPQELRSNLISSLGDSQISIALQEHLLGNESEIARNEINDFICELETILTFFQNNLSQNSKHELNLAIFKRLLVYPIHIAPEFEDKFNSNRSKVEQYLLELSQNEHNLSNPITSNQDSNEAISIDGSKSPKKLPENAKEKLRIALTQGKTYRECAETFGCSSQTVSYYAKKYNLNILEDKSNISIEQLRIALDQGKNYRECAEIFGCSINKIAYNARKYNLNKFSNKSKKTHLTKEKLEYHLMKMTPAQFASQYGYNKQYVYSRMRAFGIKSNIRLTSDENDAKVLEAIKETPCIQFEDLINMKILSRGALSKSIQRIRDKGLIGYGYATKTNFLHKLHLERQSMEIEQELFNIVKNNPGICVEDLSEILRIPEEGILKLANNLVAHEIIQFGYVALNAHSLIEKGNNFFEEGDYNEAIKCYEKAHIIDKSLECYYNRGRAFIALSQYEKAIESFDEVIKIDPLVLDAFYFKAIALMKLDKYDDALKYLGKVLDINAKHSLSIFNKGIALYMLGRYNESLEFYNNILNENPFNSKAWYNKALALKKLYLYEDAIQSNEKALELDPTNIKIWNNKGTILNKIGKYYEALKSFDKALELCQVDAYVLNNKGNVLYNLNNFESAIICYNKAIDINSSNPFFLYNKALTLVRLNKIVEAISYYDLAITIKSDFIIAWINKGISHENLGQHKEAINCFDRVINSEPSIPIVWYYKGNVLINVNSYQEANECFSRAIDLNPMLSKAWNGKGLALTALGLYSDARIAYSRAERSVFNSGLI